MPDYMSNYTGLKIDEIIAKGISLDIISNGWFKITSTPESPINLNEITTLGNYCIVNYINGNPFSSYTPINISVININGILTQLVVVINRTYKREYNEVLEQWNEWTIGENTSYIYIQDTEPSDPIQYTLWIDTTTPELFIFKIYNGVSWSEIIPVDAMHQSVYDTTNKNTDFYEYTDNIMTEMNSVYSSDFSNAIINSVNTLGLTYGSKASTFGNGIYIVLDYGNNIALRTLDFITYDTISLPVSANWSDIIYANGLFVAIATGPVNFVLTSTDGIIWTQRSLPDSTDCTSISYGNGLFVIFNNASSTIYTSVNGTEWSQSTTSVSSDWSDSMYNENNFVVVSSSSDDILKSTDGVVWENLNNEIAGINAITYGCGLFITIPSTIPFNNVIVSNDGITWESILLPISISAKTISFCNGLFIIPDTISTSLLISNNGIEWTQYQSPIISDWDSISYDFGKIIIVSNTNTNNMYQIDLDCIVLSQKMAEHINNYDRHVSLLEKNNWNAKVTQSQLTSGLSGVETECNSYTDGKVSTLTSVVSDLSGRVDTNTGIINTHVGNGDIHVTSELKDLWNSKAAGDHQHLSDSRVEIDASDITSGVIDLARIPVGAKERLEQVADDEARFALTIETVQTGDMVYVIDTMNFYYVIDDTQLSTENGYKFYTGGTATNIPWSSITNKPTTIETFGITDAYAKTEINNIENDTIYEIETYSDNEIDYHINNVELFDTGIVQQGSNGDNRILTAAYGNGIFLLGGIGGYYQLSYDGINWIGSRIGTADIGKIIYGNGKFIFLVNDSTPGYVTTDGISFTSTTLPVSKSFFAGAYGNELFVAVSSDGNNIISTSDGISWNSYTPNLNTTIYSIAYGNNKFIIKTHEVNTSTTTLYSSTDGSLLTTIETDAFTDTGNVISLVYGNDLFVVTFYNSGISKVVTSTDGISWTQHTISTSALFRSLSYGNGLFVDFSEDSNVAITSPDGINWTVRTLDKTDTWRSSVYGNGLFVCGSSTTLTDIVYVEYNKDNMNNILLEQQAKIDVTNNLLQESLYMHDGLTPVKDALVLNTTDIIANTNELNALKSDIIDIQTNLTEAESLSEDILALTE